MSDDPRVEAVARAIGTNYDQVDFRCRDHWLGMARRYLAAADAVDSLRLALTAVMDERDQDEALIADLDVCAYKAAAADDEVPV